MIPSTHRPCSPARLPRSQGYMRRPQGNASCREGDTFRAQGDRFSRKATILLQDSVTSVTRAGREPPSPGESKRAPDRSDALLGDLKLAKSALAGAVHRHRTERTGIDAAGQRVAVDRGAAF